MYHSVWDTVGSGRELWVWLWEGACGNYGVYQNKMHCEKSTAANIIIDEETPDTETVVLRLGTCATKQCMYENIKFKVWKVRKNCIHFVTLPHSPCQRCTNIRTSVDG